MRIAGEVKGFDPTHGRLGRRRRASSSATCCSRVAAGREALADSGLNGFDPTASGSSSARRSAACPASSSRRTSCASAGPTASRRASCRTCSSTRVSGQLAISLGIKGPNYAVVSACATGSHAIGEAAEMIKRGDADAVIAGGTEACIDPADPRRLHRDARPRRRGRAPAARVAAVRRDARRLRDGGGRGRGAARGLGARRAPRRRRSTPRCSATAPRTTRTTSRSPSRRRPASRR